MDVVTTVVTVPAIIAVVNILKKYGLPAVWSPVVAVLIGVVAAFGAALVTEGIASAPEAIMFGLITGLSASGLYDVTKKPNTEIIEPDVVITESTTVTE